MENKIGFALPGMYENFLSNTILLKLMKQYPEAFYENIKIDAIFGNFQFCIWDGGRIFTSYSHTTLEQIKEIKEFYNDLNNIPIRFIYTNNQIKEEHLTDRFCNLVTELCENELNEIVVNSSLLENYLRDKYPKYKFISSTTKCLKDKDLAIQELNNDYYKVCLDYNLNHNLDFLKTLTEEQKKKVEFLINPICGAKCSNRAKHYKLNSIFSLTYGKQYKLDFCNITFSNLYPLDKFARNELTPEDIYGQYKDMGFYSYKIEGRTFSYETHLGSIIKYLVKPEFQIFILATGIHELEELVGQKNVLG